MKIGGVICVKNEEKLVALNLAYHLELQEFDLIAVIDNCSHDGTVEAIQALNDPRILLMHTKPGTGFAQDVATTQVSRELFNKHGCDWVVPWDADEFWVSREPGSLREVLESVPSGIDIAITDGYQFTETELDDPDEENFFKRLRYAKLEKLPRVLMRDLGEDLEFIVVGGHSIRLKHEKQLNQFMLKPGALARYHYRYMSCDDFLVRVMNQAEGWLLRYGEEWLTGKTGNAPRILNWYNLIKQHRFEQEYRKRLVWKRNKVEKGLEEGTIVRLDELAELLDDTGLVFSR